MTVAELIQQLQWNSPYGGREVRIATEVHMDDIGTGAQKQFPIHAVQTHYPDDGEQFVQITFREEA